MCKKYFFVQCLGIIIAVSGALLSGAESKYAMPEPQHIMSANNIIEIPADMHRNHILKDVSLSDKLSLRLVSKTYKEIVDYSDPIILRLSKTYPKYRAIDCIILDRIACHDNEAVKFCLKNFEFNALCFVSNCHDKKH